MSKEFTMGNPYLSRATVLSNFDIIKICEILDLPLIFCSFKDLMFDVPKNNRRNKFYIINLDNKNGIGTHWTCLSTFDDYIYYGQNKFIE